MTLRAKLAAAALLLGVPAAAQAADMPYPYQAPIHSDVVYYNWTGFYVGINGGYAWGRSNWDSPALSLSPRGWLIGGTIGYNYQLGSVVWGIEGDYDFAGVDQRAACLGAFACESRQRWLATVRGRLGYAFGGLLPYITGGVAFSNIHASTSTLAFPGADDARTGWTAGVGAEYALAGNWTTKIEYLHVDLGRSDCSVACGPLVTAANNVSFKENILRFGLNYRFSGPIFSRW